MDFLSHLSALGRAAALAAGTSALYLVLLVAGRSAYRRIDARLAGFASRHGVRIQRVELLSPATLARLVRGAARLVAAAAALALTAAWLDAILHLFPRTQPFAGRVRDFAVSAVAEVLRALVGYLPNLFYIALFVVATRWLLDLIRIVFRELHRGNLSWKGFHPEWAWPTFGLVRILVVALAGVIIFPYLPGAGSPAFQAISIFVGGLAVLGSSSAVTNVVSGVTLVYMRPFAVGDFVEIAGTRGTVLERGLLVLRVRTIQNEDVTLPAALVLSGPIVNYSSSARTLGLALKASVTIGYDVPWRQVHELLLAAARGTAGIVAEPAPYVAQSALHDFYVCYDLYAHADRPEVMHLTYSALHQAIQDRFFEAGVEICSPHFAAVRDGNAVAMPEGQRPAGYVAPSFRVERTGGK